MEQKYGVTWANEDHTVCQTGYRYTTVEQATKVASRGPVFAMLDGAQVDGMCNHLNAECGVRWGRIETGDETFSTEVPVQPMTMHIWRYSPTEKVQPWLVSFSCPEDFEPEAFDTWEQAAAYVTALLRMERRARFTVSYNPDSEVEEEIDPWEIHVMDGRGMPACVHTARTREEADRLAAHPDEVMLAMAAEYEALKPEPDGKHTITIPFDGWDTLAAILEHVIAKHRLIIKVNGQRYEADAFRDNDELAAFPLDENNVISGPVVFLTSDDLIDIAVL